jgi:hypothetical protein
VLEHEPGDPVGTVEEDPRGVRWRASSASLVPAPSA